MAKAPRKQPRRNIKKSPKGQAKSKKIRKNSGKKVPNPRWFKKGNPGKPLGTKNFKGAYLKISELLTKPIMINGVPYVATGIEQIAHKRFLIADTLPMRSLAKQRAMDAIENRLDGLNVQPIKNVGDGTGKIHITIKRELKEKDNQNIESKDERTEPEETKP